MIFSFRKLHIKQIYSEREPLFGIILHEFRSADAQVSSTCWFQVLFDLLGFDLLSASEHATLLPPPLSVANNNTVSTLLVTSIVAVTITWALTNPVSKSHSVETVPSPGEPQ